MLKFFQDQADAFFSSCKKEEDTAVPATGISTKMKDITRAPWKMINYRAKENNDDWIDFRAFLPACYLDNTCTFSKDGKVVTNEGPTKCDPDDPQSEEMIWAFFENEKKISFLSDDGPGTILTLDATTLKILYEIMDGADKTTLELTFSH